MTGTPGGLTNALAPRDPLEILPGPIPGVIAFGRDLDHCIHVPHCGKCGVETATRQDLVDARTACEISVFQNVRVGQTVVDESDVLALLGHLDRQDATLAQRRAS